MNVIYIYVCIHIISVRGDINSPSSSCPPAVYQANNMHTRNSSNGYCTYKRIYVIKIRSSDPCARSMLFSRRNTSVVIHGRVGQKGYFSVRRRETICDRCIQLVHIRPGRASVSGGRNAAPARYATIGRCYVLFLFFFIFYTYLYRYLQLRYHILIIVYTPYTIYTEYVLLYTY